MSGGTAAGGEIGAPALREPRLRDLRFAGQLALWSFRQGLHLILGEEAARRRIQEALAVAEVPRALAPLETFLRIAAAGAHRPVEMRSPCAMTLGRDEALMLRSLAACQAGQGTLARGLLETLLDVPAARAGAAALGHVADAFSLGGLRLADTDCGRLSALDHVFAQSPLAEAGLSRLH
ncbi:hypothetical protein DKG75_18280 [Zavarzinia compransoris]|uniref:Uncharacterized protein n=1 Tax=Zavarzinia compransoris TaxID=1264899 RepID=A0A317DWL3_9PROT|nr:hypothetical protein DKG75_18280 [Zavarzinia compransoris]